VGARRVPKPLVPRNGKTNPGLNTQEYSGRLEQTMSDRPASRRESLSIVMPVYNEEDNLEALWEAVTQEMDRLSMPYELIFVNDGSSDGSLELLEKMARKDRHVRVVGLSRNFGHQNAVSAGLEFARGAAVIVMDADMQHPPSLIPEMVDLWRQGVKVVYTIREDDESVGRFKRWTSSAFYRFINAISDVPIMAGAADFRLMDRTVVDCLLSMPERSRFLRGMVSWVGYRQQGLRYVPSSRYGGRPKYSLRNMVGLALAGTTSFSSMPLRLSACVGFLVAAASVPYALWAIYAKLFTDLVVPGWASLLVAVLFMGGVQLVAIGIIGEYIGRIYNEVKGRPLYLAEKLVGFDDEEGEQWEFPQDQRAIRKAAPDQVPAQTP
jgi:dolichol-phosphate mannosyltransferase